jgi:myosin heavy subunit
MENFNEDYLQHHGTKGQRWGVRRYQNKDGSLTPAGRKRYSKEMDKLKAEEQKLKAEKKVLDNKKKTQAKFDKLDEKKAKLEADKKALKEEQKKFKKGEKEASDKHKETVEEKRERLLKSNDPNELYKNKDVLSTAEINERLARLDAERRLSQVAASTKTSGMERVDKALKTFKKVDEVYNTLNNSAAGKIVKKKLGIGEKTEEFNATNFLNNINKKSNQQVADATKRLVNQNLYEKTLDDMKARKQKKADEAKAAKEQAAKDKEQTDKMAEAKKQVDEYNERWARGEVDDNPNTYGKKGKDLTDNRYDTKEDKVERVTGEVITDAEYDAARNNARYIAGMLEGPVSQQSSQTSSAGESAVTALANVIVNSEAARAGRLLLEEAIK